MRDKLLTGLTVLAILLLLVPYARADEFDFYYQKILEIGPQANFSLTLTRGKVSITSNDDDRIVIDVVKRVRATSGRPRPSRISPA